MSVKADFEKLAERKSAYEEIFEEIKKEEEDYHRRLMSLGKDLQTAETMYDVMREEIKEKYGLITEVLPTVHIDCKNQITVEK